MTDTLEIRSISMDHCHECHAPASYEIILRHADGGGSLLHSCDRHVKFIAEFMPLDHLANRRLRAEVYGFDTYLRHGVPPDGSCSAVDCDEPATKRTVTDIAFCEAHRAQFYDLSAPILALKQSALCVDDEANAEYGIPQKR